MLWCNQKQLTNLKLNLKWNTKLFVKILQFYNYFLEQRIKSDIQNIE